MPCHNGPGATRGGSTVTVMSYGAAILAPMVNGPPSPCVRKFQSNPSVRLRLLLTTVVLALSGAGMGSSWAQTSPEPRSARGTALRLTEFFKTPNGPKGLEMSAQLTQANGQMVRLSGYMVQQERPALGHFILAPRPVRMSEHADGDADDLPAAWVMVYLDAEQHDYAIPYQSGLIELSGLLEVGRLEEQDGRVSWVRLYLPADAARTMDAASAAEYLHALHHVH